MRVPSWQVEPDIAAGSLQCILRRFRAPADVASTSCFSPRGSPRRKARALVDYLVERWRIADPFSAVPRGCRVFCAMTEYRIGSFNHTARNVVYQVRQSGFVSKQRSSNEYRILYGRHLVVALAVSSS